MNDQIVKKLFIKHRGIFILIVVLIILSIFSAVSALFWDQPVFTWQRQNLNNFQKPLLVKGLEQLGKICQPVWLLLCWALLCNCRKKVLIGLIAIVLIVFSVLPIKLITHRLRPRDIIKDRVPVTTVEGIFHSWSFPSGDTASAFAIAAAIAPFLGWIRRNIVFALSICVGIFRMVSFSHYLADVLAGAVLGIIVGYISFRLIISKPALRKKLLQFLSRRNILAGIIIIPVIIALSEGTGDLLVFLIFYPPLVIILYLLFNFKKLNLLSKAAFSKP